MGNAYAKELVADRPSGSWADYTEEEWRSDRIRELDRLGGLSRPPIARGQSFSAKLQFLAESVKKQGDVMQEMLLPPPAPKVEAKYTGFMLATERRAFERMLAEKEAAALAAADGEQGLAEQLRMGSVYAPSGAPVPHGGGHRASSTGQSAPKQVVVRKGATAVVITIAPWRLRMWAARRRVMLIVLTVMRLRRGKRRKYAGNKLDNLGFMIPRMLADDLGRFVDEQRKYGGIKEELEGAKAALDDMLHRNGASERAAAGGLPPAGANAVGALASEDPGMWPSLSSSPASSRQGSLAARTGSAGSPGVPGLAPAARASSSTGRNHGRLRGSDSGAAAAAAAAALRNTGVGVSPARGRLGQPSAAPHSPAHSVSTSGALPVPQPPAAASQTLGFAAPGPARLTAGLGVKVGLNGDVGTPPDSPKQLGVSSPKQASLLNGPLAALAGGIRRSSTPGLLNSPPTSREASAGNMPHGPSPLVPTAPTPPSPNGGRRSSLANVPLPPASVTAGVAALAPQPPGFSSMATRRFSGRPSTTGQLAGMAGLVTTGPTGPLNTRMSVTSAVAAKHGQIMQVQAQIDAEFNNLKKSGQMLSMFVNRANAAWPESQQWGVVDANQMSELQAFTYSEQYRIYQADLVRRLRQGTICLQVFAGEDLLAGNEKRPGSHSMSRSDAAAAAAVAAADRERAASGGEAGSKSGSASTRHAQLMKADSGMSRDGSGYNSPLGASSMNQRDREGRKNQDLWTSDPWGLIDRYRPGIMPQTDRIQGPTLGARILCQLALAVQQLAGPEALSTMPVLVHINEDQMEDVVQELWSYKFFGLNRENVMLVASPLHTGYRYNHEYKVFEKEYGGVVGPLGSGYSMLQLTWAGEAFIVSAEGAPQPLDGSAFQVLAEKKVEWLVSRRARDLALLHRDAILDVPMLAYCMALKDRSAGGLASGTSANTAGRANIVVEVASCDNLVDARAMDSFILRRVERAGTSSGGAANGGTPPGTPKAGGHGHGHHPHAPPHGHAASSPRHAPASPYAPHTPAHGHAGSPHGRHLHALPSMGTGLPSPSQEVSSICELRLSELGTPKMIETVNYLRAIRDGQITVGLSRYLLHLPSLVAMLPSASALRPKLNLSEELVRVGLDLGDLLAAPKARTLAVTGSINHGMLLNADDLEKVIPLLQAQDHDVAFREMLASNRSDAQGLNFVASTAAAQEGTQVIVVFVVGNRVSAAAVDAAAAVARPGRDVIHLVTCVSNSLQKSDAEEVLKGFQKRLLKSMVDTHIEVLVRGVWGLLDVLDNYVTAVDAKLVVMGSQHLTSNDFNYVIGSITLSVLKRLHLPVLVITANSRGNLNIGTDAPGHSESGAERGRPGTGSGQAGQGGAGGGGSGSGPSRAPGGTGLRCLALVENHARNMLSFMCTRLMDAKRGDKLLLAQVQAVRHLTRQQAATVRRTLDNFNLLASSHGYAVNRVLSMEGSMDDVLAEAVAAQHIQMLAVALPQGLKSLPPVLVSLLRSCRGATLVYKEAVGAKAVQARGGFGPGSAAAAAAAAEK